MFNALNLGEALERSRSERKLLLVDATAPWCGPCRMMDRTTWLDANVVGWIATHAIACQLDVDAHGQAAKHLDVMAMPTVIAFADGVEIDRVVGFQSAGKLLAWLEGLELGKTSIDAKRAEVDAQPGDVALRISYAQVLLATNRLDDAAAEYVWLWQYRCQPEVRKVVFHGLRRLARHSHDAIRALRAEIEPFAEHAPSPEILRDWLALNDVLGEPRRSLQWFDAHDAALANTSELAEIIERYIGPLLLATNRWRDVWRLYNTRLFERPVRELAATWSSGRRRLRSR